MQVGGVYHALYAPRMSVALTKRTTDHSDGKCFSFSFFCDRCGKEWTSPVQRFSGGVCSVVENDEARKLLWSAEHRAAFDAANLEAHFHFNNCPQCGNWVCDDCFCIEEWGDLCGECLEEIRN